MTVLLRSAGPFLATFLVPLFLPVAILAETPPQFASWNTADGLPQNSVKDIARTSDGYIWFTTLDGLVRFDGVRFKVFKKSNSPGLGTNRLSYMMVDKEDRLWMLSEDQKSLFKYESGRFESFTPGVEFEADYLREPFVERGSMHFRAGEFTYVFKKGKFHKQSEEACADTKVWFSREHDELVVDGQPFDVDATVRASPVVTQKSAVESSPHERYPIKSVELPSGTWFYCPSGNGRFICRFKDSKLTVTGKMLSFAVSMERDRSGNLWFSDTDGTFGRIPPEAQDTLAFGFDFADYRVEDLDVPDLHGLSMYFDSEKHFWMGTSKGLFFQKSSPLVTVLSTRSGLPSENINAIAEGPDGAVWFGAWQFNLVRYLDGKFDLFDQKLVTALYIDKGGRVWSGTSSGVTLLSDGKSEKVFGNKFSDVLVSITTINEDHTGAMWFGAKYGIIRVLEGESKIFKTPQGIPSDKINAFLETRSGDIWVGTSDGLAKFEGDVVTGFTEKDGMSSDFVRSLYEDEDGTLWIGTYDNGLIRYKNGRFTNIQNKDGLFGDGAFCILEDNGWFWISNNQGIYRVRRDELNRFSDGQVSSVFSASYGPEDGLTNVEANGGKQPAGIKTRDGKLMFATSGGVAIIDPKEAYGRSEPPTVRIEEVTVDTADPVEMSDEIVLEPGHTNLVINYTAFDYENPKPIQFRYRLEGLDEDWTIAKNRRTAYFSHLPYGDYVFHVTAANRNGVWDEKGATTRIVVARPFYRTYWFYSLVVLAAVGMFGAVYFYRVRQLKALNDARADFTKRLIETQESERQRIALELHDSIGQSLVVIRNRALLGLKDGENQNRIMDQMQEISDASAAALQETREIAHNLHPYQIRHLGLASALRGLIDDVGSSSGIHFNADIQDSGTGVSEEVAINVYRIAQECLNNVVRHSGARNVNFVLNGGSDSLRLSIEDDGKGFDPAGVAAGLGLRGIRERAEMIGGRLKVASTPGKGTSVELTVYIPETANEN